MFSAPSSSAWKLPNCRKRAAAQKRFGELRKVFVGNVCMDQAMIDVTGTDAQVGDFATIFGDQLPIQEIADKLGTIPYEILTSISRRVQRIYFYE